MWPITSTWTWPGQVPRHAPSAAPAAPPVVPGYGPSRMSFPAGTVLDDRYELGDLIATGGMGDIRRAIDQETGEPVAVKLLRGGVAGGARRFEREARTLEQLDHPNVVRLLDAGSREGVPYLVMELIRGPSLRALLDERGSLPAHEVARFGGEVAAALRHAHDRGMIHRDVKPANILFDAEDRARLADFGIVRLAGASALTATGVAVGTAAYVAPEQLEDPDAVSPATDVYSLGLVVLESLTGQQTFRGSATEAAFVRLSRDPEVPEDLPVRWRRLLRAMTARDPRNRPDLAQLLDVLEAGVPESRTETLVMAPDRTDVLLRGTAPGSTARPHHGGTTATGPASAERSVPGSRSAETEQAASAGLGPRMQRYLPHAVIGLLALAAIIVVLGQLPGDEPDEPVARGDLPPELHDAIEDLREAVQP
jgi:eukaryotic-like serine/threonine-protein kinase